MTRNLRNALLAAITVGATLSLNACKTACDSGGTCSATSTKQFTGTPVTQQLVWTPGTPMSVTINGGKIRVGNASTALTVKTGAPMTNQISVTFTPFVSETAENQQKAIDEMKNALNLKASADANGVFVAVDLNAVTHDQSLSAYVDIIVPSDFNGAMTVKTDSGDVSIQGAKRGVSVSTGLGNIAVAFNGPVTAADGGTIVTSQGDITFDADAKSDMALQAISGNEGRVSASAAWVKADGSTATSASFRLGTNPTTGLWKLDSSGFFTSKIDVLSHLRPTAIAASATPAKAGVTIL